ncbi:MAG: hypothetical protein M3019_01735 [Candidatus Dormibacteraeota bacterium]|nr:hypothetical protein [Candidatus Dormibacteraeota bacterium]
MYQVSSHNYSFMASSNYGTAGVYNDTGQWNTESYTFSSNTNWTTSWQLSTSASVSASIYIIGIQASTGVSVSTSASKGTGWSLTASVSTPPYQWAFFQPGFWGEFTKGTIYYVYSNCTETYHGTVYYANAPHPGAAAIHAYHS